MLRTLLTVLLLGCLPSTAPAASVGMARIAKYAPTAFNDYTATPSPTQAQWMRDHYARMLVFSPYFDERLSWYPNGWVYKNLYAIKLGTPLARTHREWILRDGSGRRLYIPFNCGRGACPQYAADIGDPGFRADWIASAGELLARGYVGLLIDDVNMLLSRVSDGHENAVAPHDPRTGVAMTEADWRRYMAEFVEQIRAAFPSTEIVHNALWFVPTDDPHVQRQLLAADVIAMERGFNDDGITTGAGTYGFETMLGVIDWLHARGRAVWLDSEASTDTAREYGLAGYLLTTTGDDYIGNTPGAEWDDWWSGYDVDLGAPSDARTLSGGVFRREFANGRVLVNQPGAGPVTVELDGAFVRIDGSTVSRVTLAGGQGAVLRRTHAVPPTCPPDGAPDADACAPCTHAFAGPAGAKLAFADLLDPPGEHRLRFRGSFREASLPAAIDPLADGVRLLVVDRAGAPRIDVTIPGGPFDRRARSGWRGNRSGTAWRYRHAGPRATLPNGITSVRLRRAEPAGKLKFSVKGSGGSYPIDQEGLPVFGTLVLDPLAAEVCGDAAPPPIPPPGYECGASRGGDTVRCR